jgi:hypothetical protein
MPVSAQRLNQWPASSHLKSVTTHKRMIYDFLQHPIPTVHEEQIKMKAQVRTRQFLRVQVTVKDRRAWNPIHYISLNPSCLINACCTSIGRNCILLFAFLLSDEASARISYCSYALFWIPMLMLTQHCSIETRNEFVIKWCGVYK